MKVWCISYQHCDDGAQRLWAATQAEALKVKANLLAREDIEQVYSVEPKTIPNTKSELLSWLNAYASNE